MDYKMMPLALCGLCMTYVVYMVVYRLYFHPLARFPGPKMAAMTKYYEGYYDLIKRPGGQFMYELNRMHKQYGRETYALENSEALVSYFSAGPIVRINPDELHIQDSGYIDTLYCVPLKGKRDKYPPTANMVGTPEGVFGTIDHDLHRKRKAAISPFFSKATVLNAEAMINQNARLLCNTIRSQITRRGFAEIRPNFLAYATDNLCEHAFSNIRLDLLKSEERARLWMDSIHAIAVVTPLAKQFPWTLPASMKLPLAALNWITPIMARIAALRKAELATKRFSTSSDENLKNIPDIFDKILLSKSLPDNHKSADFIAQSGFEVIAAGGETSARILSTATFNMLSNKDTVLARLVEELEGAVSDHTLALELRTLENLPWLTAVVKESLRTSSVVTSRSPLVSSSQDLQYQEWTIPAGTPVSMCFRDLLLDPSIFPDPHDFRPERWLDPTPEMERAYVPFGRGSRMCVGMKCPRKWKTNIRGSFALAEIYICLAHLVRELDLDLYDTVKERDFDIVRDCFVGEVSPASKGVRVTFASANGSL
ncbi:cytochrome P450 [Penicillium angulare]|uniref:Cytochrome P450 n=1 Tax=Penicillium angulare TaxID=116970 RepID=A0A9W9FWR4_9EURO|nr:cytochrome P450 [Penicillium angulare]